MNEQIMKKLREMLPDFIGERRLLHTYAVEEECISLARMFCVHPQLLSEDDAYKLRIAALLHDITKEKSVEEHIALAERYHIPLSEWELASPKVLHAKTAPALAADVINQALGMPIVDLDIQDAIRTHTTGSENMSMIGKLLYLADYIEPTRTFADCVELRRTFYEVSAEVRLSPKQLSAHLDRVLIRSFDMTICDLVSHGEALAPATVAARNALLYQAL